MTNESRDARPLHLRWAAVALVAAGGAVGTGLRAQLATALPSVHGLSWSILGINVVGAFCLGLLLESLAVQGPDVGGRRRLRLLVGTGLLGGFTTYSTLANDAARLLQDARVGAATGYALLTLVAGVAAAALGVGLAARRRSAPRGTDIADGPPGVDA